jgi:chromosome partitioning protein
LNLRKQQEKQEKLYNNINININVNEGCGSVAKVWAVSTNKGGVLKTSITTNLAGILAKDKKVLIVDTETQGNCLVSFGLNPDKQKTTIYDVMVNGVPAEKAIVNVYKNIDVLGANDDMENFDFDILMNVKKYPKFFYLMKDALSSLRSKYDYILVDALPYKGLVHGNILTFADKVIIPFQPESYSMRSLVKMIKSVEDFKTHNPTLSILGVVATLVDQRTTLHTEVIQECRKYCAESSIKMFETVIPRSVRFASSVAYSKLPAVLTDSKNDIVNNYFELLKEIKQHD